MEMTNNPLDHTQCIFGANMLDFFQKDVTLHFLFTPFLSSKYKVSRQNKARDQFILTLYYFLPVFFLFFAQQRQGSKHERQQIPNICEHILIRWVISYFYFSCSCTNVMTFLLFSPGIVSDSAIILVDYDRLTFGIIQTLFIRPSGELILGGFGTDQSLCCFSFCLHKLNIWSCVI